SIFNAVNSKFTNCSFFNCGGAGALVNAAARQTHFIGCSFGGNSVTTSGPLANGLQFASGCQEFVVSGCSFKNGLFASNQGFGIGISSGCDNFSITGNMLIGNATGPISDASGLVNKTIFGNVGYKTESFGSASILIGQTVTTVTHGLAGTPNKINVIPKLNIGLSGAVRHFVTAIGPTTFQIAVDAVVSGVSPDFFCEASI
ncbi:MAG: right-handed parallel beta-helix repeat-containing protein, partial [Waterburya sp.]